MKYDHQFHAGNFADLLKHIVFAYTLSYMQQKKTPIQIIDTHAGYGHYAFAELTEEAATGIKLFLSHQEGLTTPLFQPYIQNMTAAIKRNNVFLGSSGLAASMKRDEDSLWAFEKMTTPFEALSHAIGHYDKVYIRQENGLAALKALLPPPSRRALVLIDPPYERLEEYTELGITIKWLQQRFPQGTYMIWYPHSRREGVLSSLFQAALGWEKQLWIDYSRADYNASENLGLQGSGLLIFNPPYQLQQDLECARQSLGYLGLKITLRGV